MINKEGLVYSTRDNLEEIDVSITETAVSISRWIPVSEKLPEEETDVLICNINGDEEIARGSYSAEIADEFIWYTSGWKFGKVIAWMPLPEPYGARKRG